MSAEDLFRAAAKKVKLPKDSLCEYDDCETIAVGCECEGCGGTFCSEHSQVMPGPHKVCLDCPDQTSRTQIAYFKLEMKKVDEDLAEWKVVKDALEKKYVTSKYTPADSEQYHAGIRKNNDRYKIKDKKAERAAAKKRIVVLNKWRRELGLGDISDKL
jgi:hypothetical protein